MSIAIVVDTFPRWSERFIARELNELKRRGLSFSIYCLKAGEGEFERDPEFAELIPHRVVLPACFIPSVARDLGMDAPALARRKLVEDELGIAAFRKIGCANSLTKLIREHRHTHVYAHFASLPSTLAWLAAEALALPLIVSVHARDVFVEPQLLTEKMRSARRVFTCNERALGVLQEKTLNENGKAVLMRHGLPLEYFPFRRRGNQATRQGFNVLAAGRFVPKKGFGDLLEALASPALADMDLRLTLLGEGPERKKLEKQLCALDMGGRVRLPGVVNGAGVRAYFDEADVFAMPSRQTVDGDSDGVPNVALEAMALGVPVIGTRAGSLGDVLNNSTGTIVSAGDIPALATAIRRHVDAPAEFTKQTENARSFIEAQYDIRKNIDPLLKELGA